MKAFATLVLGATLGGAAFAADQTAPESGGAVRESARRCIDTSRIIGYVVESDEVVRLQMKGRTDVMVQLRRICPQLHYHGYIAFTPVNGELCAGHDDIVTRTGLPCKIESFTEVPRGTAFDAEAAEKATHGDAEETNDETAGENTGPSRR